MPFFSEPGNQADAYQIVPVFERLTKTPLDHFPILLIGGRPIDPRSFGQYLNGL